MSNNKTFRISAQDLSFDARPTINESTKITFEIECYNEGSSKATVQCALPSTHRKVEALKNIPYPFKKFLLPNYDIESTLNIAHGMINVPRDALPIESERNFSDEYGQGAADEIDDVLRQGSQGTEGSSDSIELNFDGHASWTFLNQTLSNSAVTSSSITSDDEFNIELEGQTCVKLKIVDNLYTLEAPYTATSELQILLNNTKLSNDEVSTFLNETIPSLNFLQTDNKVTFLVKDSLHLRYLQSKVGEVNFIPCKTIDQSPAPNPRIVFLDQNRYIISKNQQQLLYLDNFAFTANQWISIVDYPNNKIYSSLVLKDDCFKLWTLIPLPAFVPFCWCCLPFCLPILIPFWFDVDMVNLALKIAAKIIQALADFYLARLEMMRNLIKDNLSVQSLVKIGKKAVGVAKALVNGDLNDQLLGLVDNIARIATELVDTIKNGDELLRIIEEVFNIGVKIGDVLLTIGEFLDPTNILDKIKVGSLELIQQTFNTFKAIIASTLGIVKDIINLIKSLPANIVTRHLKKIVNSIDVLIKTVVTFVLEVRTYGESLLQQIDLLQIPNKLAATDIINKITSLSSKVITFFSNSLESIKAFSFDFDLSILDEILDEIKDQVPSGKINISVFFDKFKDTLSKVINEETLEEIKAAITEDGVDQDAIMAIIISTGITPLLGEDIANDVKSLFNDGTISDDRLDSLLERFVAPHLTSEVISHIKYLIIDYLRYREINQTSLNFLLMYLLSDFIDVKFINHIELFLLEQKANVPVIASDIIHPILRDQSLRSKTAFSRETESFYTKVINFDPEPQFNRVKELVDLRNADMEFLNTLLEDLGIKEFGLAALEAAEKQEQSEVEKEIEAKALEVAAAADEHLQEVMKTLKIREIEAFVFEQIYRMRALLDEVLAMLQDILGDQAYEEKKRIVVNKIKQLLKRDIYEISRFGSFDPNNPDETQLVINDINGVKIYAKSGKLLWNNTKFAAIPFVEVHDRPDGCDPDGLKGIDPNPCGGDELCRQEFWFKAVKRKVSFSFMDNHNLALGGIRTGDFDGDGFTDLWAFSPSTTKGIQKVQHKVVFSPLKTNFNLKLPQEDWCSGGNVFIGDFNGDLKDDALCITLNRFYLLHGSVGNFSPASNTNDGFLSLGSLTNGWRHTDTIAVADIDGDGFADLIKMQERSIDVLFGHKIHYFISNYGKTQKFINGQSVNTIKKCYESGINRMIVGDINQDKKDDIICIPESGNRVILYSTDFSDSTILNDVDINPEDYESKLLEASASGFSNPRKKVVVVIEDVELQKSDALNDITTYNKQSKRINNLHSQDSSLISHHDKSHALKVVRDISYNFDCFNTVDYNLDVSIAIQKSYEVPTEFEFSDTEQTKKQTIFFEAFAHWNNNNLIEFYSSPLSNVVHFVESAPGLAYNTSLITSIKTLNVEYTAKASIYIEEADGLLSGQELRENAEIFLGSRDIKDDENSISIPMSGQISLNVIDFVHHEIIEGN